MALDTNNLPMTEGIEHLLNILTQSHGCRDGGAPATLKSIEEAGRSLADMAASLGVSVSNLVKPSQFLVNLGILSTHTQLVLQDATKGRGAQRQAISNTLLYLKPGQVLTPAQVAALGAFGVSVRDQAWFEKISDAVLDEALKMANDATLIARVDWRRRVTMIQSRPFMKEVRGDVASTVMSLYEQSNHIVWAHLQGKAESDPVLKQLLQTHADIEQVLVRTLDSQGLDTAGF